MREAATCRRGNENAGLGTNRFYRRPASFSERYALRAIEIPAGKRGKNADIKRILDKEGEQMLAAAGKNRIVTHIPGKPWDTPQLAAELERWKLDGRDVSLLIRGLKGCRLPVKRRRSRAGRCRRLPSPIRWFACWSQRVCTGRGASPPTILITVSDKGALSRKRSG